MKMGRGEEGKRQEGKKVQGGTKGEIEKERVRVSR